MTLRPYPDYRPSGLPWIGQIPSHWEVRRLKAFVRETSRVTQAASEPLLSLSKTRGLIRQSEMSSKPPSADSLLKYKVVLPGEVVMNRMQAWNGLFGLASEAGLVSPDYTVFAPSAETARAWLLSLLREPRVVKQFQIASRGIGSGFFRLYTEDFGAVSVPVPPTREQEAIAAFVAAFDARVNRLVGAKQRLLKLLAEQRQGIVQRAVTRGLDPSVPMKPSGVPWLGDIPAHWERQHLGSAVKIVNGFPFDSKAFSLTTGLPLVRIRDIRSSQTTLLFSGPAVKEAWIETGDLLVGMDGDFNVARWSGPSALLNQRVCCLRTRQSIETSYLAYLLPLPLKWINDLTFSTTVKHLSSGDIRHLRFHLPPLEEQQAIVEHLNRELAALDAAAEKVRSEIDLVREYRTRLVSDVVTGRLDVRDAVLPPLPGLAGSTLGDALLDDAGLLPDDEAFDDTDTFDDA